MPFYKNTIYKENPAADALINLFNMKLAELDRLVEVLKDNHIYVNHVLNDHSFMENIMKNVSCLKLDLSPNDIIHKVDNMNNDDMIQLSTMLPQLRGYTKEKIKGIVKTVLIYLMDSKNPSVINYHLRTPGGRELYRDPSGMGTVMVWNDNGVEEHTLILDAKYRTKASSKTIDNPRDMITDYPIGTARYYKDITDDVFITEKSSSSQDTISSKNRTNLIADTSDAAKHCRSILVNGIPCDLPNINCLVRIYAEREQLDSMDPTLSEYSQYALTNWFNTSFVWSSSSYGSDGILLVDYEGIVLTLVADYSFGVVPIIDKHSRIVDDKI